MPRSKTKITIETIQELCEKHNWTSLEETYINANTSMEWQCNVCAFTWKSNYNNTRKSKGYSRCRKGSYKYTHEDVVIESKKNGCNPDELENYILKQLLITKFLAVV
uniref:Zinc-ribbon domain-containing protein n=1 Tax=viral metagenome TaxID=1070528 RepID=A0A6C0JNW3_9ZZZZ